MNFADVINLSLLSWGDDPEQSWWIQCAVPHEQKAKVGESTPTSKGDG